MNSSNTNSNFFRKFFLPIFKNNELHFLFSSVLIFIALYITICALLQQSIINPFALKNPNMNATIFVDSDGIWTVNGDIVLTIMSLFVLWIAALVFGRLAFYLRLPPLLGMLIIGVIFRNVFFLSNMLAIEKSWEVFLRSTAFILILIRCGVGLNHEILKNTMCICGTLGICSTTLEVLAIVLTAHFIFGFPVFVAIVFGYVLASTSPAVTVPTMIHLQENMLGTSKGIPTIILASASIDNLYCITAFYFMLNLVFMEHSVYSIAKTPLELILAVVIGILIGLLLQIMPRSKLKNTSLHFIRGSLILSISLALYFGFKAVHCDIAGPVSILCMCTIASMRWKKDNPRKTIPEEKCFRTLWVLVFQPYLFVLIGLVFDFSKIQLSHLITALEILVIGVLFRIIETFFLSFVGNFNFKEKLYVSIGFLPKATVQAALVPVIYDFCSQDLSCQPFTQDILQTLILSIIITAPVGQILLQVLAPFLLEKQPEGSIASVTIENYNKSQLNTYIPRYPSSHYISAEDMDYDQDVFDRRF